MDKIVSITYRFSLLLLFLPAFAFMLGERSFRVLFIPLLMFFGILLLFNIKKLIGYLIFIFKNTSFRYLVYFIVYIFLSSLFLCLFHKNHGVSSLVYTLQFTIFYILPCFLLAAYTIPRYLSIDKFTKFYLIMLFVIFLFGLIEYFGGKVLHIEIINKIQQFLANERNFIDINEGYSGRLCSVFAEPGWLGGFLFLNFPIIYNLCKLKEVIFKNKILNLIIKKTLVPLAWLNLLFTFSPIWLIFCIIQFFIINIRKIFKIFFRKIFLITIISVITLIIILLISQNVIYESTQAQRIINTLTNVLSLNTFILVEPSLGARIVSYIILIKIFLAHFWTGVGLGNASYFASDIVSSQLIPLTIENFRHFNDSALTGKMQLNTSALYTLLAETGIIGTFLYYLFLYKTFKNLSIAINKIKEPLIACFANGLHLSLLMYMFMTIYDTFLTVPYNWFFLGLIISVQSFYYKYILTEDNNEEN